MARKLAFVLALTGLCLATAAYALGLGNIQSDSSLNQPLSARVPLVGVSEDEASSVSARLASPEAFERAGVDRPFSLSRLEFEVKQGADGPYVEITTKKAVKEPFLDFLVEVSWPRGKLVREYTLLLNPPTYAPGGDEPAPREPAVAGGGDETADPEQAAPREEAGESAGADGAATVSGAPDLAQVSEVDEVEADDPGTGTDARQYTVQANDTLWEVSRDLRPDGSVSINQTMLALLRENPDAFIDGDMNRLKRGAILRVPEGGDIGRIPVAEANSEVRRQIARWQRNRGVAGGSGVAEGAAGTGQAPDAGGQQQDGGELRVVAPEDGTGEQPADSAQGESSEALNQQVTLLRESNASLEAENEELKAQVEALKKEVSEYERGVNVETDQQLPGDGQQQQADEAPADDAADETAEAEQDPAGEETAEAGEETEGQAGTDAAGQAEPEEAAAEQSAGEEQSEEEAATEETQTAADADPQEQAAAEPEPAEEPPVQTTPPATPFWQNPMILGLLAAVILVLLLLVYLVMRRRGDGDEGEALDLSDQITQGQDESEDSEPLAGGFDEPAERDGPVAELDEESPELPPESDALGEAEVYLAYGRHDQAREVLDKGLEREPDNKDLRLKMLEVLALSEDRAAFEEHAQQLHSLVSDDDPAWQRALEMGRDIAPEHPLFGPSAGAAAGADDNEMDFDLPEQDTETAEQGGAAGEPDKAAAGADDLADLDFNFEEADSAETPAEPEDAAGNDFDLDFGLDEPEQADAAGQADEPGEADAGVDDLDFDLSEPSSENPATEAPPTETAAEGDDAGGEELSLEFDLDEDEQSLASPTRDESEFTGSGSGEDDGSDGLEDFDFDFDETSEQESAGQAEDSEATTRDVGMQSTAMDYGVEETAESQAAGGGGGDDVDMLDEISTKLDLARAYLDMGDNDGARALLDEVVDEGNEAQIKEARELLGQAG